MRRKRLAVVAAVLFVTCVFSTPYALTSLAGWLVLAEPLQPANAVVVLGGQLPFRAMGAAAIYRAGWAPEVWLTRGGVYEEEETLVRLGIQYTPEVEYSRQVLERVGVPASAIRILEGANFNTADEMRTISARLRATGGGRVIVVTSKFHSRRVRATWNRLVGASPQLVVRYANDDPFEPERWWRNSRYSMAVAREVFGLLNLWSGFPLQSQP